MDKKRLQCTCGSRRFKVEGVDALKCSDEKCGAVWIRHPAKWVLFEPATKKPKDGPA